MADLVIDEWLWSDLAGANATEKQQEAFQFLDAVFNKCDRLVTVKGSRFDNKALEFWKHTDVTRRRIAKYYRARFWYNSDKSLLLEEGRLQDLSAQVGSDIKADDQYLVRAYLTAQASVIITTDNPLKNMLSRHDIVCKHRDEFVSNYVSQYGQK